MPSTARKFVKAVMPPALLQAARAMGRKVAREQPAWEFVPGGWDAVERMRSVRGWNVASAAEASARRAEALMVGNLADRLPFGTVPATVGHALQNLEFHNTAESFAHAFLSSTRLLRRASVLDWGGGVGQYFAICRALAPDLDLDYHCVELAEFTRRGRELYPQVTYHETEDWRQRRYDFVFASCSLHYEQDWSARLRTLAEAAAGARLFVTRLPVCFESPGWVFIQRPYVLGFETEYASWCVNRSHFLAEAHQMGLRSTWEFVTGERPDVHGAPERPEYRGFLFDVPSDLRAA